MECCVAHKCQLLPTTHRRVFLFLKQENSFLNPKAAPTVDEALEVVRVFPWFVALGIREAALV